MTFQGATMNLDGLTLKRSLEPKKEIGDCVLACVGVRKRWTRRPPMWRRAFLLLAEIHCPEQKMCCHCSSSSMLSQVG